MFQSLALGGGGVRGGLHVGALAAIEKVRGNLQFPDGIYGSSVGSILATAIAFNLSSTQIHTMFLNHFNLENFVPQIRLSSIADLMSTKGLFTMEMLESALIRAFQSQHIDIQNKTIGEAPQKLYIVASNMTTQNITVFSGNVRILDAIKCSSCLPLVFEPQILYNQVYLDGGVFVDSLTNVVPDSTLVLHISAPAENVFPADLEKMTVPSFIHRVYRNMRTKYTNKNMIWLQNTTIGLLQDLTEADKQLLYDQGYSQTLAFLTKRISQELK
jgi:predicted acylesterase/phospholipase RssA